MNVLDRTTEDTSPKFCTITTYYFVSILIFQSGAGAGYDTMSLGLGLDKRQKCLATSRDRYTLLTSLLENKAGEGFRWTSAHQSNLIINLLSP